MPQRMFRLNPKPGNQFYSIPWVGRDQLHEKAIMQPLLENKYIVLRKFLSDELREMLYGYTILKRDTGQLRSPDERVPGAPRMYADPFTEVVLARSRERVEAAAKTLLYPTYSYLRAYSFGADMAAHKDRNASEIAVTVDVGGDSPWPIWLKIGDEDVSIDLEPGDALMYLGREVFHWRQAFTGSVHVQAMLFYVRQSGEFTRYRYDGRPGLGWLKR